MLHVIPSMSPNRGGPSFVMRTLARTLSQDMEVHVATTDDDGEGRIAVAHGIPCDEEGATFWYFPRQTRAYTFSWPLTLWLWRNVSRFDLVHIHALFSYPAIAAAFAARRANVPYLVRPLGTLNRWGFQNRHPLLKRLSFFLIERRVLSAAAAIHYTSEQELQEAETLSAGGNAVIIPNPVDLPQSFERNSAPEWRGRQVILFLSRLNPKKGLDLLLAAFARVYDRNPRALLVIAGAGDPGWVASLHEHAERLKISENVLWTGFLEGKEKVRLLSAADVFVLPSYSENFGVAVAEALAYGCPVVVSDQVGIHAELRRAGAGLVSPCKVSDFAEALTNLLSDVSLRERVIRNGRRLVTDRFSPEAVSRQLIHAYTAALQ